MSSVSEESFLSAVVRLTYLIRGTSVKDQMIALIPPIMSSSEGAGPLEGQMPLRT